ncbi:periplasmic nitrate reductase component NapL [Hydrogenimonas sp.]|nr:periplasmic nitrate reductase component NapL [Hydrogenimonas sp.]
MDVFDIKKARLLYRIALDPVKDGRGVPMPARILSVDILDSSLLIVSIGEGGFRNLWLYRKYRLKKLAGEERKLYIKEARFSSDGFAVLGTFGSEAVLYGIEEGYEAYRRGVSESTIGDMVVSGDGERAIFSDEAGEIRVVDIGSGKTVRKVDSRHLDKIGSLAYEKGVLISGGHDRKVGIHSDGSDSYYIDAGFPVFCVGLSPDAKIGVFLRGDDQVLQLFDVKSGKLTDRLVGHSAIVNQIRFVANRTLLTSERGNRVLLWHIGE